jgi:hypothetical protein
MDGQDFKREDNLDTVRFNRMLWAGLMGEDVPYPTDRHAYYTSWCARVVADGR